MPASPPLPSVTLWTCGTTAAMAGAVITGLKDRVHLQAVGGPRDAAVDRLARERDLPRSDDFRQLLVDHPPDYLFLTTPEDVSVEDLRSAATCGAHLITTEPPATELGAWNLIQEAFCTPERGGLSRVPAFLESAHFLHGLEPEEMLGGQRVVTCQNIGSLAEGSLFTRLLDAWETALAFIEMPQTVDAALTGPLPRVPDDLRAITGHITAHGRSPGGGTIAITASDRAGRHDRSLHVLGRQGQLRVFENGYWLVRPDGQQVDGALPPAGTPTPSAAEAIMAQWRRRMDRPAGQTATTPPGRRLAEALACCQASLLSARTGQPESPPMLLRIGR